MTAAIRKHDPRRPITIGLLPIKSADAENSRGFVPRALAGDLDFIALHLYPESKKLDDALATVKLFDVPNKPLVIEEIFPLTATPKEVGLFIQQARAGNVVDGFVGFYWGRTVEEMDEDPGPFDKAMLGWLELFAELNPNRAAASTATSLPASDDASASASGESPPSSGSPPSVLAGGVDVLSLHAPTVNPPTASARMIERRVEKLGIDRSFTGTCNGR
jgi:hypothetical protein